MRLFEISDNIRLESKLLNYFEIDDAPTDYIIKNDIVDFIGNVYKLKKDVEKLPIKFNKCDGSFNCSHNKLITLEGSPKIVNKNFNCNYNQLTSLEGGPEHVDGNFNCDNNHLTSLNGLPKTIGKRLWIDYRKDLPLLKILFVKNLQRIYFSRDIEYDYAAILVSDILTKYLGQGRKGAILCAAELMKAGFKENARL